MSRFYTSIKTWYKRSDRFNFLNGYFERYKIEDLVKLPVTLSKCSILLAYFVCSLVFCKSLLLVCPLLLFALRKLHQWRLRNRGLSFPIPELMIFLCLPWRLPGRGTECPGHPLKLKSLPNVGVLLGEFKTSRTSFVTIMTVLGSPFPCD